MWPAIYLFVLIILTAGTVGLTLPILDRSRELVHRFAIDLIEISSRWEHHRLDIDSRRAKLEDEKGRARLELTARRFELLELPGLPELPEEVKR